MNLSIMKKLLFVIVIASIGFSGCKDFLDKTDPTATTFEEFFNDEEDLHRVVYSSFRDVFDNKGDRRLLFYMKDGRSDNAYARNKGDHHQLVGNGSFNTNSRIFEYYYTIYMKHVGRINTYIANIDKPYVEDEETRDYYRNQLKGLRIWHYFRLTNRWGDVPFSLEPTTLEEATIAPTPKEQILDTLFLMGEEIAKSLPAEKKSIDYYMFNKHSFKALLMRYALYDERYELAAELAKEIMESGQYELYPDYGDLFQYDACCNNDEFILWQSKNSYVGDTWSYNHMGPPYRTSNGDSYLVPLKSLVDSYWTLQGDSISNSPQHTKEEYVLNPDLNRDPRYKASIIGQGDLFYDDTIDIYDSDSPLYYEEERSSSSGYWFRKFVDEDDVFRSGGDFEYGLIRYAEVLLTYAEAKIMMNDIDPLAKSCINQVRERAGLDMSEADVTSAKYSSYTQDQWIDLIRNERRIEFAAEGQRYNDILRWGIAEKVLNKPALGHTRKVNGQLETIHIEERSFEPNNYLWPFHESMLKLNPNLEQNPGY